LNDVVLACLAKDPTGRPATAEDLDRMLSASVVDVAWTNDDAREWWQLHQVGR
jgi:hypothetical protein